MPVIYVFQIVLEGEISMRYIFIVNPEAGDYSSAQVYVAYIERYCLAKHLDAKIYYTEKKNHAREIVQAQGERGDRIRVYGFGGDGTLHEIAEGAINKPNVEIGIFAFGSGNDYVKTFSEDDKLFRSVEEQLGGSSIPVDVIKSDDGEIALNQCSLGLDAKVAMKMEQFKRLPFVSGSMAYKLALGKCAVFSRISTYMKIEVDKKKKYAGEFMFALIANGQYYGGGYKGAPEAEVSDGVLDFVLMRKLNRLKFASIQKIYQRGEHVGHPKFSKALIYEKGERIHIKSDRPVVITYDGECFTTSEVTLEIIPRAINFIVPRTQKE